MHFPLTCRNKVTSQLSAGPYYYITRQIKESVGTGIIENKLLRFHIAKKEELRLSVGYTNKVRPLFSKVHRHTPFAKPWTEKNTIIYLQKPT